MKTVFKSIIRRLTGYAALMAKYDAMEQRCVSLQRQHDTLVHKLKHLEEVYVPAIAGFQATRAMGKPVIFEDNDHLLFECDAMHVYPAFVSAKSVLNDPKLVQYLKCIVQPGDTVLDVGANIGGVAILCGKLTGETGRVFAIEAEAITFEMLRRNIALNHMEGRITAVHAAVYSSEKTLTLNVFDREANAWNTLGWFEQGYAPITTQEVRGITLDSFCSQQSIDRIDLLKVDVEGAEPEVFAGAGDLLARQVVRKLVFEVSKVPMEGMGHQVDDIIRPLQAAGYILHQIGEQGDLAPVDLDTLRMTFFANYVALCPDVAGVHTSKD